MGLTDTDRVKYVVKNRYGMVEHYQAENRYDRIPDHMVSDAKAYVDRGERPYGFLEQILRNNFVGVINHADDTNKEYFQQWAFWLYNDIPGGCWGSVEAITDWCKKGGLEGMRDSK